MSKVIASLEKVLLPFAVKIGKQPHVNAIKNGFIKLMPLTLAGAMFVLINNVFLSFGEGSFFYSLGIRLDASTIETLNGFKAIGGNVYNGTLGIMSLMAPFFIGMALAEERKVDPLAAGLLSVAAFMTVTPYSVGEAYAVGANWLGGANIISGIVIGLANLLNLIEKEMKVAMTLTGTKTIGEISQDSLVQELSKLPASLAALAQGDAA